LGGGFDLPCSCLNLGPWGWNSLFSNWCSCVENGCCMYCMCCFHYLSTNFITANTYTEQFSTKEKSLLAVTWLQRRS
jgi:hypothetical protein